MAEPAPRVTTLEHDGLTFLVRDEGPPDGEPVVLLHGFPERSSCWDDVVPALHAAGLRTVALDQRGYSPGARPPGRRDHDVRLLADDVRALVDRLGGRAHVVGHDWGAVVAWTVAQRHPGAVRTLTAVSVPHPAAYLRAMRRPSQAAKGWYTALFNVPGVVERLSRRPGGPIERSLRRSGMTAEGIARFRREMVADGAVRGGLMWYRAVPVCGLVKDPVAVPTTMVWSDRDDFIARSAVDLCPEHVQAPYELVVLHGVSHWVPTEAPGPLAEAVLERVLG